MTTIYALQNRPAGFSTLPSGWTACDGPANWKRIARHGFVSYDAPLSKEAEASFELVRMIPKDEIVLATRTEIDDYIPDYQELFLSSPEAVSEGIFDAAERAVGVAAASVLDDPGFVANVLGEAGETA